jgi:hypothetical protein
MKNRRQDSNRTRIQSLVQIQPLYPAQSFCAILWVVQRSLVDQPTATLKQINNQEIGVSQYVDC